MYKINFLNIPFPCSHHSDDPLLSRATDDNQNEFSALHKAPKQNCNETSFKRSALPTTMSSGQRKLSTPKAGRKKGQFKLRFHHQALPQEYKDHYEAAQKHLSNGSHASSAKLSSVLDTPESPQDRTNENIRNWLQKISELQNEGVSMASATTEDCVHLPSTPASQPSPKIGETPVITKSPAVTTQSTPKVMNYNDLPFMGEMTLDNSKPRRGRKPKKADICHLIYKNYGTIFPGSPFEAMDLNTRSSIPTASTPVKASPIKGDPDLQNKSSLLEKRLTVVKGEPIEVASARANFAKLEEPLNLCLRDTLGEDMDSLTVSSENEYGDDDELAKNLKLVLPNLHSSLIESVSKTLPSSSVDTTGLFWPEANVYMHPMALYYQKLLDSNVANPTNLTHSGSLTSPQINRAISGNTKSLMAKKFTVAADTKTPSRPGTSSSGSSLNSNRACQSSNSMGQPVQKRKRSAIFIPPMPLEASNSATEVSICKFKFTGGAKPSLQEKKMLSVDSGGNFRYYSGTGDKSMRGYEFFPRERLQQSALGAGSSAGAFLNAHGEKFHMDLPTTPTQYPLTATTPLELSESSMATQSSSQSANIIFGSSSALGMQSASLAHTPQLAQLLESPVQMQCPSPAADRRKRKSRRSIQREKLEKTFKEKGFLIQTQQTESADSGATFCKFRQLKKFTRYLFRSWKNYLPDMQQQLQRPSHNETDR